MTILESAFVQQYRGALQQAKVPENNQSYYFKWLNQYLDFSHQQTLNNLEPQTLDAYLAQLPSNSFMKRQACHAVKFYFTVKNHFDSEKTVNRLFDVNKHEQTQNLTVKNPKTEFLTEFELASKTLLADSEINHSIAVYPDTEQAWIGLYRLLTERIKVKHYSDKTLKVYTAWLKRFENFVDRKDPAHLDQQDIVAFLSHLAVEEHISASSQNQAFHALLFVYKKCLHRKVSDIDNVVRAKQKPYLPVVLSRAEIESIFQQLESPYLLVVKLLYGCGLRLNECLNIRLQDINLDIGMLTIHDGKGQKDRTMPLPKTIYPELKQQMAANVQLLNRDLQRSFDGVFLKNQLDKKYKNASKSIQWQWLFPAKQLTQVPETQELRRYHLHESHVQKAINAAVKKAMIFKRASAHSFRHSFASHLLMANVDIFTIQKLMGHSDIRTTLIYLQTVPSTTIKEAISPLDLDVSHLSAGH